jgi:SAM-dependent methyltransferase
MKPAVDYPQLLKTYPRNRAPLPEAHARHYHREIVAGREGLSIGHRLVLLVESWMHRMVAKKSRGQSVLELGAGTLNHLQYERHYENYDVVEPFNYDYSNTPKAIKKRIRHFYRDLSEIPFSQKYDRIVSIAVLEHLENLPAIVAQSGLKLNPHGCFQAGIPSEGEFLWHACSNLSTGILFRLRTGLDYATLMRYEHINLASEIVQITEYFFEDVSIKRFPFALKGASIYTYLEARNPILERCQAYANHD